MADRNVSPGEIDRALAGELPTEEMQDVLSRLCDKLEDVESELEEVRADRDEFEAELEDRDAQAFNVLRSVRDWFDNVFLFKRPMDDPRAVWKQVERALQCE